MSGHHRHAHELAEVEGKGLEDLMARLDWKYYFAYTSPYFGNESVDIYHVVECNESNYNGMLVGQLKIPKDCQNMLRRKRILAGIEKLIAKPGVVLDEIPVYVNGSLDLGFTIRTPVFFS